ncbi:uncharacterized protein DDB_G0290301-like [Ptychodera flava]|uniref:uncharacterized protein DDB_G0290301-like n=1 Tax=Ptychodera flava TaxID=63121 RepID=UPI003969FE64
MTTKAHLITQTNYWEPRQFCKALSGFLLVLAILGLLGGSLMVALSFLEPDREYIQQRYRYFGIIALIACPCFIVMSLGVYYMARAPNRRARKIDVRRRTLYALGYDPKVKKAELKQKNKNRANQQQSYNPLKRNDQVYPKRSNVKKGYEDTFTADHYDHYPMKYKSPECGGYDVQCQGRNQHRPTAEQERYLQDFIDRQQQRHQRSLGQGEKSQSEELRKTEKMDQRRDKSKSNDYALTDRRSDVSLSKEAVKTLNRGEDLPRKEGNQSKSQKDVSDVDSRKADIELENIPLLSSLTSAEQSDNPEIQQNQQASSLPPTEPVTGQINQQPKPKPPTRQGTPKLELLQDNKTQTASDKQCTCNQKKKKRRTESKPPSSSTTYDRDSNQQESLEVVSPRLPVSAEPGQNSSGNFTNSDRPQHEYQVYSLYDVTYDFEHSPKILLNMYKTTDLSKPRYQQRRPPDIKRCEVIRDTRDKYNVAERIQESCGYVYSDDIRCQDKLKSGMSQGRKELNSSSVATWNEKDAGYSSGSQNLDCISPSSLSSDCLDFDQPSPVLGLKEYRYGLNSSVREVRFKPLQRNQYDVTIAAEEVSRTFLATRSIGSRLSSLQRPLSFHRNNQRQISYGSEGSLTSSDIRSSTSSRPSSSNYDDISDDETAAARGSIIRHFDCEFLESDSEDEQSAFV